MATLVLTAVGSVLGGPIGGAIGAIAGRAIDGQIFRPKGRQGPRLQDLKVQMSSYGAPIPKLFGTLRVAGTVIWATDLIERRSKQGGGKGRPATTTYSYTASFAVLLSARPIRSVGRIWADGNLLRGAGGDWKSETGFRLHLGGEEQAADPFIASAEGSGGTPAYRGRAYAVFENMALGDFGNRIPSLTFEVEADAAPLPVGTILDELSGKAIVSADGMALRGFAASGDSVGAVIEALGDALPLELRDDGQRLRLRDAGLAPVVLDLNEIGDDRNETLGAAGPRWSALMISYYEPARDYQLSVQQARRPGGGAVRRLELPAALHAEEAKAIAEDALARSAREQARRTMRCGWARIAVGPGAIVQLADEAGLWRVASRSLDREGVRLELVRERAASAAVTSADPGRGVSAPDRVHGSTILHLLDLPNLADTAPASPRLYVVAAGSSPGWRRASLLVSLDEGASWSPIGSTAPPAILGEALSILPPAPAALFDLNSTVEIELPHEDMILEEADEGRVLAGANLAVLGNELIQFGRAEPLGASKWRLSRLTRGRRGTEWAGASHAIGEPFVLIEAETMLAYDPPIGAAGGAVRALASGIGDPAPVEADAAAIGEALRPPRPAHLRARRETGGGFTISWIRSSRIGWAWTDGVDTPLGEEREAYRLTISRGDGVERTYELVEPRFDYGAADAASDAAAGASVTIGVVQLGTGASSRPALVNISL